MSKPTTNDLLRAAAPKRELPPVFQRRADEAERLASDRDEAERLASDREASEPIDDMSAALRKHIPSNKITIT